MSSASPFRFSRTRKGPLTAPHYSRSSEQASLALFGKHVGLRYARSVRVNLEPKSRKSTPRDTAPIGACIPLPPRPSVHAERENSSRFVLVARPQNGGREFRLVRRIRKVLRFETKGESLSIDFP